MSGAITGYWIALCSDEPGVSMDGDILADLEPVDPAYARVAYGTGGGNWGPNGNYLTTLNDITFAVPGADWGDINHFALCSAATSGELYAWGEFLNPQYVSASDQVIIPAGGLMLTLSALDVSIAV